MDCTVVQYGHFGVVSCGFCGFLDSRQLADSLAPLPVRDRHLWNTRSTPVDINLKERC